MGKARSYRERALLVSVSDKPVGSGAPGPVTRRLLAAYRELVERETGR